MEIKSKEFYHIHRIGNHSSLWEVGNRINWVQKRNNLFYDHYSRNGMYYDDGTGSITFRKALQRFKNQTQAYKIQQYERLINASAEVVKSQSMFIRETIFEEVRKNYFPQLPSRLSGIWVCNKDAVQFWWKTLNAKNQKILKLKLTGTVHIGDEKHLIADTFNHDDLRANAFKYWTGSDNKSKIGKEILFEGIIDVTNSYDSIQEMNEDN